MAKVSNEQIKKIALGILIIVMAIGGFWFFMLQPQGKERVELETEIKTLNTQIETAERDIRAAEASSQKAAELQSQYNLVVSDVPSGAPIAWFPPRIQRFLGQQGINEVSVSQGGAQQLSGELSAFEAIDWSLALTSVGYVSLGKAIAALENEEPLIAITSLKLSAGGGGDQEFQSGTVELTMVTPTTSEARTLDGS